jgi:hypothetical protein
MRAAIAGPFDLALPAQAIAEARRHLDGTSLEALEHFLSTAAFELIESPPDEVVAANLDLVRSRKDVPIALALLEAGVEVLVTNDRDFTDDGATAERFSRQVRVLLPAVFLREIAGWTSEALEAIRDRRWADMPDPWGAASCPPHVPDRIDESP